MPGTSPGMTSQRDGPLVLVFAIDPFAAFVALLRFDR